MGDRIISSTEEQATGAFVDMLNGIRAEELLRKYEAAAERKSGADQELQKLKEDIQQLIENNRGGKTGMHGFIGERVQVGFENERAIMRGSVPEYVLLDDNGMTDYVRGQTLIQQKACISDKSLGLTHVRSHSEKYPVFLEKNGVYQIPKDFYEKYKHFLEMPESVALKLRKEDLRMWRRIQEFHESMPDAKVEPMIATYAEIQADVVGETIQREADSVARKYQKQRQSAEESCKATLQEGAKVTLCSAALEGVVSGGISIIEHKQGRIKIQDFSTEDWKGIGIETARGVCKGTVRGVVVYATTNVINMPASVATATVTGAFTVVEKTVEFSRGEYTGKEYAFELAEGCASVAVSAVSSELGRKLIPIPVLGSIIGNAVGMFVYKIVKGQIVKSVILSVATTDTAA